MDIVEFVGQQAHLSTEDLADYVSGSLESPLKEAVDRHLDGCRFCRAEVAIWSHLLQLPFEAEEVDDEEWDLAVF